MALGMRSALSYTPSMLSFLRERFLSWWSLERRVVGVCLGVFFLIGMRVFADYGLPYDAATMDQVGYDAYNYVFLHQPWATNVDHRYHGTFVELPINIIVRTFALTPLAALHVRSIVVFLFFFVGVWIFYILAKRITRDWRLALAGCVFLVLSPRIFAHAFYNSRDIPYLALFAASMLTLMHALDVRTLRAIVLHAVVCSFAMALRMTAILLPALTLLAFVIVCLRAGGFSHGRWKGFLFSCGLYLGVWWVVTIISWPFLWQHPLNHFISAYQFMSTLQADVFYLGRMYHANPWHYVFVSIFVTTPLLYTALFLCGFAVLLLRLVRERWRFVLHSTDELLVLLWFFVPLVSLIAFHAQIYQEWRHVFFVYPAFLLMALIGLQWMLRRLQDVMVFSFISLRATVICIVTICTGMTGLWMIHNHPFENVYFSIPSQVAMRNFPLDYWGLSYRQALAYLLKEHPDDVMLYYSPQNIAYNNGGMFFRDQSKRLIPIKDVSSAHYILDTYRPDDQPDRFAGYPLIHAIAVDGMPVVRIYKGPFDAKVRVKAVSIPGSDKAFSDYGRQ